MHHGYYVQGNKPKNMEDHRWVSQDRAVQMDLSP